MEQHGTLRTLWRFVRPELEELAVYIVAIMALFSVAFYQVAVRGIIGADTQGLISTLGDAKHTFLQFLSQDESWGKFFLFGVWFIIGTVVYIIAWSIITIVVDVNRDIKVSSSFVHPNSFHQSNYWLAIIVRWLLRAMSGVALVFYGVFWIIGLAPVWIDSFANVLTGGMGIHSLTELLLALLSIAVTLHIAAILLRIMLLRADYSYR